MQVTFSWLPHAREDDRIVSVEVMERALDVEASRGRGGRRHGERPENDQEDDDGRLAKSRPRNHPRDDTGS